MFPEDLPFRRGKLATVAGCDTRHWMFTPPTARIKLESLLNLTNSDTVIEGILGCSRSCRAEQITVVCVCVPGCPIWSSGLRGRSRWSTRRETKQRVRKILAGRRPSVGAIGLHDGQVRSGQVRPGEAVIEPA